MTSTVLTPDIVRIIWTVIESLPDNLYDYDRDSFGMANLMMTCGYHIEPLTEPSGAITVKNSA